MASTRPRQSLGNPSYCLRSNLSTAARLTRSRGGIHLPVRAGRRGRGRVLEAPARRGSAPPRSGRRVAFVVRRAQAGEPLWPGKWARHNEASGLVKYDLSAARAAWSVEAKTPEEKAEREAPGFLTYRDPDGRVADFHSLRHRFVTELVNAGVAPKDAKELARHSSIILTMDRYAHIGVNDTAAAVAKLNLPAAAGRGAEPVTRRPAGTDRENSGAAPGAATGGGERERLRSNEDTALSTEGVETQKIQAKSDKRGPLSRIEEVHPEGFEPSTFGSVDRCSIQLSYGCVSDRCEVVGTPGILAVGEPFSTSLPTK